MKHPLVSVICLCHNQAKYVANAIQSVWNQDYDNIELIVVDDASTDKSQETIQNSLGKTNTTFISLDTNLGNCKAFNQGFLKSSGDYIIDLAADDVLLPSRVLEGVKAFKNGNIGIHFCDSYFIDSKGQRIGSHYQRNEQGQLTEKVPHGLIYQELIERYFISPPTMMMKRSVLEELGGYDEELLYEDFDFWIRSARNHAYGFSDQLLVEKRRLPNSLSSKQFLFRSKYQKSTLKVCRKIKRLNQTLAEDRALKRRVWYEVRQCIRQGNWELVPSFLALLR